MLAPYLQNFKQSFRIQLAFPADFIMGILQTIFSFGSNVFVWVYVVEMDTPIATRISYFMFINGLAALTGGGNMTLAKTVYTKIKDGTLTDLLIRPISPIPAIFAETKGREVANFIIGLVFISLAMIYTPVPSAMQFIYFLISLLPSFIIFASLNVVVGSLAFWTTEVGGIKNAVWLVNRLLNGQLVPVETLILLGGFTLSSIVKYGPFTAVVYLPTHIFIAENLSSIQWNYMYVALIWMFIFPLIAYITWKRGIRKYNGIGI